MTSFELWAFTNGDSFMIISSNSNLFTIKARFHPIHFFYKYTISIYEGRQ